MGCGALRLSALQMPGMPEKKGMCGEGVVGWREKFCLYAGSQVYLPQQPGAEAWLQGGVWGKAASSTKTHFLPHTSFLFPLCCCPPVPQTAAQQRQTFQVPQLPPCVHGCCLVGGTPGHAHGETRQGLHLLHLQPGLHLGECLLPWGVAEVDRLPWSSSSRSNRSSPPSCCVRPYWLWLSGASFPPLTRFFPLQETYLMKHMRKHNIPDPQQQVVQAQAQASQQQQHFQPQGGGAAGGPSGDTNQPNPPPQCSFDLTPYKTSEHHKDICLTVSTSAIQVEHLSSS